MMDEKKFLADYFELYRAALFDDSVHHELVAMRDAVREAHGKGNKVIFAGNGGSAAIASHCAVDYTKGAGVRAINFNESDLISCYANDFGFERWLA